MYLYIQLLWQLWSMRVVKRFGLRFLAVAQQPSKDWCKNGIEMPHLLDDDGNLSVSQLQVLFSSIFQAGLSLSCEVELLVVQAPLFSTNPQIGQKLRWLDLFHTALVLKQQLPGKEPKNWTIEFDSVSWRLD